MKSSKLALEHTRAQLDGQVGTVKKEYKKLDYII